MSPPYCYYLILAKGVIRALFARSCTALTLDQSSSPHFQTSLPYVRVGKIIVKLTRYLLKKGRLLLRFNRHSPQLIQQHRYQGGFKTRLWVWTPAWPHARWCQHSKSTVIIITSLGRSHWEVEQLHIRFSARNIPIHTCTVHKKYISLTNIVSKQHQGMVFLSRLTLLLLLLLKW